MADETPRFLLLVPPTPSPPTLPVLKEALDDTFSQVLKEVASASAESSKAAILEIALACPHLTWSNRYASRGSLYDETQAAVAGLYKLVCVIAARDGINVEDADGVDVRILLVAWSPEEQQGAPSRSSYGPVIGLDNLAQASRPWQYAFGVESEAGEAMVKAFVTAKRSGGKFERLQGESILGTGADASVGTDTTTSSSVHGAAQTRHFDVAVGGTFDHLHIGHKLLLTMTLFVVDESSNTQQQRSATVGITGDQLLKNKKHASVLESWDDRQKAVEAFCDAITDFSPASSTQQKQVTTRNDSGPNGKGVDVHYPNGLVVKCTEIQDPFGPTITEENISVLIISAETRSGGKAVNDKRKEKGWKELDVFEVNVLDAEEEGAIKEGFESKLSSTAIREKIAQKTGTPSNL